MHLLVMVVQVEQTLEVVVEHQVRMLKLEQLVVVEQELEDIEQIFQLRVEHLSLCKVIL